MWLKSKCVCEREFVYLICTVLVSPLSADASRDRHLIWGELRRLLAYWAYEQRQSYHNTVYNTHTMNYTSYAGKQWEFNILHWLYRQCHSFLHLFPSIIPPTATKHVYKSLLLWSSRVIRLSAIDWLAIKCQVFPGGGYSAVQPVLVSWHGERARPQEGEASHNKILSRHTTSWMRRPVRFSQKEWRADKTEQFIMLTCLVSLLNIHTRFSDSSRCPSNIHIILSSKHTLSFSNSMRVSTGSVGASLFLYLKC